MTETSKADTLRAKMAKDAATLASLEKAEASVGILAKLTTLIRGSKRIMATLNEVAAPVSIEPDGTATLPDGKGQRANGERVSQLLYPVRNWVHKDVSLDTPVLTKAMAAARDIDPSGDLRSLYHKVKADGTTYPISPTVVAGMAVYRKAFADAAIVGECEDGVTRPANDIIPPRKGIPPDMVTAPRLVGTASERALVAADVAKADRIVMQRNAKQPRRVKAANRPLPIAK